MPSKVIVEPPRDDSHGDLATNAAMVLSKQAGLSPQSLAEKFTLKLATHNSIDFCEIARPGFINIRLKADFWLERLRDILKKDIDYGSSELGQNEQVNIEYVSANPTGPIHIGHARGAIYGDVLAALMTKAGYKVTKEYYVNDAGEQVDQLARATYQRYLEALGYKISEIEEYSGDYLKHVGQDLANLEGDKWVNVPEDEWLESIRIFSVQSMMKLIRKDLQDLGVEQEVFASERALIEKGKLEEGLEILKKKGLIYTGVLESPKGKAVADWNPVSLMLFRSTHFGDDVDRPLKKISGDWTYIAGDMAYHLDKIQRGNSLLINVWGADHGGYVKRTEAAVEALSDGKVKLVTKICQLVRFMDKGQPIKMSKRAGAFIAVHDVVNKVGRDVVRFIMMMRKNDAPLDFDFAKVVDHSRDNPIFYVQYAHARACSVKRHIQDIFPDIDLTSPSLAKVDLTFLNDTNNFPLIKLLSGWPRQIEIAAREQEPHRLAFYLYEIASAFHILWNKGREHSELRFIVSDDSKLTIARFALVQAMAIVIASGLNIFGINPVEEMR
jgi:arginyl-tRNA synthetase